MKYNNIDLRVEGGAGSSVEDIIKEGIQLSKDIDISIF